MGDNREFRKLGTREHRLNSGTWATMLHGTWDLPRPGIEPMSPALAGGFFTTELPGKPNLFLLNERFFKPLLSPYQNGPIKLDEPCKALNTVPRTSVQFIRSVVSDSLRPHESQHARPLCH